MAKHKVKAKQREDLFKGMPPHIARLYKAVDHYVRKSGGSIAVIGGVQIQQWPGDGEHRFTVAIKCTGIKPPFDIHSEGRK